MKSRTCSGAVRKIIFYATDSEIHRFVYLEICEDLCQDLSKDMKAKAIVGLAVTVKIKSHDFRIR
jgi:hypothetical protein